MKIYKEQISGWGNYPRKNCDTTALYYPPEKLPVLPAGIKSFTPKGMGRSYGDACISTDQGLVIECSPMNKFISFDKENGVIEAFAGVTLEEILNLIIPHGWFLPVVPGTRFITLGGALASNVHGKNHHNRGAIQNFVLSLEVMTEKGLLQCSETENQDLFYATIGGLGLTGIIIKARIALKKISTAYITSRLIKVKNFEEALEVSRENYSYEHSVTWIDCLAKGKNLGRGIVMLGNHTEKEDLPARYKAPLKNKWMMNFSLPDLFPSWTLNPFSVSLFNFLYYNKQFSREKHGYTNFESWFFPLDMISNWNILYGKQGFLQYQFVIPQDNGLAGIREALELLSKNKIGSFLAVLKIVKEDSVMLPFATPGFTLALDIPLLNKEILNLLSDLDRIVLKYGGRLYMTKDARLSPDIFREMNPAYKDWLDIVRKYSPEKLFNSLLAERIKL